MHPVLVFGADLRFLSSSLGVLTIVAVWDEALAFGGREGQEERSWGCPRKLTGQTGRAYSAKNWHLTPAH